MVYAIVSDIHANEIALSAVLEDARSCGAESVLCLGDVVGYGPEPEKTVSEIRKIASAAIVGNHDAAVARRLDDSDFIDLAADAVSRHRDALSPENLAWLKSLPLVFCAPSFACVHGDFTSPESFEYLSDEECAAANFAARKVQLLFVGHTHVPELFLTGASGRVYRLPPTDFTLEDGKRYIVNPGSVGYPRTDDGNCESTYVLFDDAARTVTFRRLPFTVRSVMQTGRNPKRVGAKVVAAAILATALAAGAAAWLLAPQERVETITEVVAIAHSDRTEAIDIPAGAKKVQMLVKLAKKSPPVQLLLEFRDASGNTLCEERETAKRSRKKSYTIPKGATSATLSAGHFAGEVPAAFDTFEISATP